MAVAPGDDLVWVAERAGLVSRIDLERGEVVETVLDITAETEATANGACSASRSPTGGCLRTSPTSRATLRSRPSSGTAPVSAAGAGRSSRSSSRSATTTAEIWPSAGTGSCTSASATAARGETRSTPDRTPRPGSGPSCGYSRPPTGSSRTTCPLTIRTSPPTVRIPAGRPEIFLIGVRNPWRFSFDRATDDLWIADVGQDSYEEVTVLLAANGGGLGANLGWRLREGLHYYVGRRAARSRRPGVGVRPGRRLQRHRRVRVPGVGHGGPLRRLRIR